MSTQSDIYEYKKPTLMRLSVPDVTSKKKQPEAKETASVGNEGQTQKVQAVDETKANDDGVGNASPSG
jgi:hypothetical protein